MESAFNDPAFKMLFNLGQPESIRRSSIPDRLSKIDTDYFREAYECIYEQFSRLYLSSGKEKYNLTRAGSPMLSEAGSKLQEEGIGHKNGEKPIKYSIAFDGILPSEAKIFTGSKYSNGDTALPEAVRSHAKQENGHQKHLFG